MFPNALTLGSIRGIRVRLDPSWFVVGVVFTLGFWVQLARGYGHDPVLASLLAVAATVGFFASVLAHELAHALEATHRGVHVGGITLFLFGGVTETRFDVRRPGDEFALSAIGPWSSLVLAALFGLAATAAASVGLRPVADVTGLLAWVNLLLGAFNLLPGAPLDGGRILRSAVWKITNDRIRAVRVASRAGQVLGGAVVAVGLYQTLVARQPVVGLINAGVGWFLHRAATAELSHTEARVLLADHRVGELVNPACEPLATHLPVAKAVEVVTRGEADVRAVRRGTDLVGAVGIDDLARVPEHQRAWLPISRVMRPLAELTRVSTDTPVTDVLEHLETGWLVAVVDDDDRVVGLMTWPEVKRRLGRLRRLADSPARRVRRRAETGHGSPPGIPVAPPGHEPR